MRSNRPARGVLLVAVGLIAMVPVPLVYPEFTMAGSKRPQPCEIPPDERLREFRLADIDRPTRCLLTPLVAEHTTSGTIGPLQTPVGEELYAYLLDRPVITATLVERLGMGAYRFTPQGPGRYWVDDGDGTEGLLTLVFQDGGHRIYYMDGFHHGQVFSSVHATAAVFMTLQSGGEKPAAVSTSLVAFARLDDRLLAGLVWLLRPLLEGAITRKLTRGFEVTYQLALRISEDPARILEEASSLPFDSPADFARFASLLPSLPLTPPPSPETVPSSPSPAAAAPSAPDR
jgi:hypothetical protein